MSIMKSMSDSLFVRPFWLENSCVIFAHCFTHAQIQDPWAPPSLRTMRSLPTMRKKGFQKHLTCQDGQNRRVIFFSPLFAYFYSSVSRVFAPVSVKTLGSYHAQNVNMVHVKTDPMQGTIFHQQTSARLCVSQNLTVKFCHGTMPQTE